MSRYIDAETILILFNEKFKETQKLIEAGETQLDNLAEGFTEADEVVRSVPPADVQEVRHGKNICKDYPSLFECSLCRWYDDDTTTGNTSVYNYCPNCGTKMDLDESNGKRI